MKEIKSAFVVVLTLRGMNSSAKADEYGAKIVEEACFSLQQQIEKDTTIAAKIAEEAGIALANPEDVQISEFTVKDAREFLD